jgi:DNA-binding SARP family transcriptional activator
MKHKIVSTKERPLLTYALSKLNPEVFSHPVWVRFCRKEKLIAAGVIDDIFIMARKYQADSPNDACQLMLIGAVYQNYAEQPADALTTLQQILELARRAGLTREILWANWGACAICFQQNNNEQAVVFLDDLQAALGHQNEWILADYVDTIKQFLLSPNTVCTEEHSGTSIDRSPDDLVRSTFTWLQQWGFWTQFSETELWTTVRTPAAFAFATSKLIQTLTSIRQCKGFWHALKRIFQDKLKAGEGENDTHPRQSAHDIETRIDPDLSQTSHPAILSHPPDTSFPAFKSTSVNEQAPEQTDTSIPLTVQMLGTFSLTIQDSPLIRHATRGLSLLKYLLLHHKQNTPREVLMDTFWPDAEPETARNNLNVAMHSLRRALHTATFLPLIIFKNGAYGLDPLLQVWLDVEQFERCIKAGQRLETGNQRTAAVIEYENAVNLYRGDFLADTPYESWTVLDRERLRITYLDTLDHLSQIYFIQERYTACVTLCQLILTRDLCREDAHCRLMRCYNRLGQGSLALRQYQICAEALQAELEIDPAPETTQLYEKIHRHEQI